MKNIEYKCEHCGFKSDHLQYDNEGKYLCGDCLSVSLEVGKIIDYGADPVGDGTFKMVPSGDVVDFDERCRRLQPVDMENKIETLIGSKTKMQVNMMQGGKLTD